MTATALTAPGACYAAFNAGNGIGGIIFRCELEPHDSSVAHVATNVYRGTKGTRFTWRTLTDSELDAFELDGSLPPDLSSPSPEGARTVAESTHADSTTQLAEAGTSSVETDLSATEGEPEITRGSPAHPKCVQIMNRFGLPLPLGFLCGGAPDHEVHRLGVDCGREATGCIHHEFLPAGGEA